MSSGRGRRGIARRGFVVLARRLSSGRSCADGTTTVTHYADGDKDSDTFQNCGSNALSLLSS